MRFEHYYKDNSGYVAHLDEWVNLFNERAREYPEACFYNDTTEEYIAALMPVAKVNNEWVVIE